jgi:hypothetical protein
MYDPTKNAKKMIGKTRMTIGSPTEECAINADTKTMVNAA